MTVAKAGVIRINTQQVLTKNEIRDRVPCMLAAKDQKVLCFDAANDVSYAAAIRPGRSCGGFFDERACPVR